MTDPTMSFDEKDVRFRWDTKKKGYEECLFVQEGGNIRVYYRRGDKYIKDYCVPVWAHELFSQLDEARRENESLKAEVGMLSMGFKPEWPIEKRIAILKEALEKLTASSAEE
jgi:hypothetical protein